MKRRVPGASVTFVYAQLFFVWLELAWLVPDIRTACGVTALSCLAMAFLFKVSR